MKPLFPVFRSFMLAGISALTLTSHSHAALTDGKTVPDKVQKNTSSSQDNVSPLDIHQKINGWDMQCSFPQKNTGQTANCQGSYILSVQGKDGNRKTIASITLSKSKPVGSTKDVSADPFTLAIVSPLGFSVQKPVEIKMGEESITPAWITCIEAGCLASQVLNDEQVKSLQTHKNAQLILTRTNHSTVTINFELNPPDPIMKAINHALNRKTP